MKMWLIIMLVSLCTVGLSLLYITAKVSDFSFIAKVAQEKKFLMFLYAFSIVIATFCLTGYVLNFINAGVCAIYFAMIYGLTSIVFFLINKLFSITFSSDQLNLTAICLSLIALSFGWYLDHHVFKTEYTITSTKQIEPIKVALIADSHIGTTFSSLGFAKHLEDIQAQQPDLLVISGDFVDDDTNKENMINSTKALGQFKSKYGVYFVFGNHDKGYYGPARRGFSAQELVEELEKNKVTVLRDDIVYLNENTALIGRRDFSEIKERGGQRKSMQDLMQNIPANTYTIVLDHQPADYKNQAQVGVDLVLSGHTHGGQLFPFNYIGKLIKANDAIYGLETRDKTNFIVTSGISDWAIKFKTGTKSEYVIININQ